MKVEIKLKEKGESGDKVKKIKEMEQYLLGPSDHNINEISFYLYFTNILFVTIPDIFLSADSDVLILC